MKKLLIASNMLLLGIIVFLGCNSNGQNRPSAINRQQQVDTCMRRFCKPYKPEDLTGVLRANIIQQLSLAYANDRGKAYINEPITQKATKNKDALSIVFDIEKLKNLIKQMEDTACKKKCDALVELGIRFYYIKYPPDLGGRLRNKHDGLDGLPAENRNKHALVMVPAYKNKHFNNEWYDYDVWSGKADCFTPIKADQPDSIKFFRGIIANAGDNHGGLGPPPGTGTFATNPPQQ